MISKRADDWIGRKSRGSELRGNEGRERGYIYEIEHYCGLTAQ